MKKCDCSCGCQLTSDETYFEELETCCQGCNKGYREDLTIIREVCQKCGRPAYGLCNNECGFLCREHDMIHRHETGHITNSPITVQQESD
jgi:hypothetical protein